IVMGEYILSLDQGTTSSRAIIFGRNGRIVSVAQKEFKQIYPQSGWVEHNPKEIWTSQIAVLTEAIAKAGIVPTDIAALGITNQRETTIVWDKNTGEPVYNAVVWQDRRTAAYCDAIKASHGSMIQEKTGLIVDAYFSASKIRWILDNVKGAKEKADKGSLIFGTVDSWLIYNLTNKAVHVTDVTNASRTMLFNINTLDWDAELLELFGIPASMLPRVASSSELYGTTAGEILAHKIPIAGIAGDQQAALFGQMCIRKGMVKNTYGTGCFMLMNIGDQPIVSKNNLVTTIAWQLNGKVEYALEGSIFMAGAIVQWLRDELHLIPSSASVEALARTVADTGGVYLVPAFAGLGAPHWNQHARGTMVGMTRGTSAAHFARAALESIAFQTRDVLKAMETDSQTAIKELRVDGGATVNNLLMQIQADVLDVKVVKPEIIETTAMGAAYLAGLAVSFWKDVSEIEQQWIVDKEFTPTDNPSLSVKKWDDAVDAAKYWANLSS
ncbi:MAG TPA: glycerol kinase GlpK, partial [Flavitalea sp.]|nr:glycerol kinase GlpK [Flavitalea sp.]